MTQRTIRTWNFIHKWTSLICTLFLLMLCVTGLPLIFHAEIDALTRAPELIEEVPTGARANLEDIVAQAKAEAPEDWMIMFLAWDDEKPLIQVIVAPNMQATESEVIIVPFDSRTGARLDMPSSNEGFMYFLLDLHASLLMGLPGMLFLGVMGVVFMVSLISGVVVYAPFMRKIAFGTVRKTRSTRVKWLDTHNMVGIVTLGWLSVVGFTGFIITMSTPIQMVWRGDQMAELSADYQDASPPTQLASADTALQSVLTEIPDADISFISWPGSPLSTPYHYMVAMSGDTPLTERLIQIAVVDATTAQLMEVRDI
ncbi:MAG: PepSY domain-containing protein, partial [Parvibaculaceae bacterium]|nr:PepSY domain-containing protein [Parvibaculaceae bacterium]